MILGDAGIRNRKGLGNVREGIAGVASVQKTQAEIICKKVRRGRLGSVSLRASWI